MTNRPSEEKTIELIARAAENKLALDIKVLDVRKTSNLLDYLVICGGESEPQLKAISGEIDDQLRKAGIKGYRWQGVSGSGWQILDLGSIVIHILGVAEREYYNLEELWGKEAIIYHY
ncbi:MAG: ribosome silencing factor [Candidatus Margulisbacteria bacterium]|nr:ribosome silencing factor [Candidatus Margulisiibacteriota bacterium]MBU1617248.1 ribosome silencing factor [Candidatus Margulisiibacteriota bacterium]